MLVFAKQRHFPEMLVYAVDEASHSLFEQSSSNVVGPLRDMVTAYGIFGLHESQLVPLAGSILGNVVEAQGHVGKHVKDLV